MTNTHRVAAVVTVVNLVLLVILLGHDRAAVAQSDSVLRGRSLELVDAAGRVRAEFVVEPANSLAHPPQETSMQDVVYTLGVWKVKPGKEAEFIAAWKALGEIFAALPRPPGTGTLVQSVSDPDLLYSFGPWKRMDDILAMRADPQAQAAIQHLRDLCTEATPGAFRVVAEAPSGSSHAR